MNRRFLMAFMTTGEIEKVLEIIYDAVRTHNQRASGEQRLEQTPDAVLFGENGVLDSLQFVSLVLAIEEKVQEEFEVSVAVVDDRALTRTPSPFLTLGSLAEFVCELLAEEATG